MKKSLILLSFGALLSVGVAQAGIWGELKTGIYNHTDRDIWVTWKASSTLGKAGRFLTSAGGLLSDTYYLIPAGKNNSISHTGDKLSVYYSTCQDGLPVGEFEEHDMTVKGYARIDIRAEDIQDGLEFIESLENDVEGKTTK
jgi:hypothetical protein